MSSRFSMVRPQGRSGGINLGQLLLALGPKPINQPQNPSLYGPTPQGPPIGEGDVRLPRYEQPGFWRNFLTQGQAGLQATQFNREAELEEARLKHQYISNYNLQQQNQASEIALTDHKYNLDKNFAEDSYKRDTALEQLRQKLDVLKNDGIPFSDTNVVKFDRTLTDPRIEALRAKAIADEGGSNLTTRKTQFELDQLNQNYAQDLQTGGYNSQFQNQIAEMQATDPRVSAAVAQQPVVDNFARHSMAERNNLMSAGGAIIDVNTGQPVFDPKAQRNQLFQQLMQGNGGINMPLNTQTNAPQNQRIMRLPDGTIINRIR